MLLQRLTAAWLILSGRGDGILPQIHALATNRARVGGAFGAEAANAPSSDEGSGGAAATPALAAPDSKREAVRMAKTAAAGMGKICEALTRASHSYTPEMLAESRELLGLLEDPRALAIFREIPSVQESSKEKSKSFFQAGAKNWESDDRALVNASSQASLGWLMALGAPLSSEMALNLAYLSLRAHWKTDCVQWCLQAAEALGFEADASPKQRSSLIEMTANMLGIEQHHAIKEDRLLGRQRDYIKLAALIAASLPTEALDPDNVE